MFSYLHTKLAKYGTPLGMDPDEIENCMSPASGIHSTNMESHSKAPSIPAHPNLDSPHRCLEQRSTLVGLRLDVKNRFPWT
jgi:hypothetical protein